MVMSFSDFEDSDVVKAFIMFGLFEVFESMGNSYLFVR